MVISYLPTGMTLQVFGGCNKLFVDSQRECFVDSSHLLMKHISCWIFFFSFKSCFSVRSSVDQIFKTLLKDITFQWGIIWRVSFKAFGLREEMDLDECPECKMDPE